MRRALPHDDLVREIRQRVAEANVAASWRYSDDMDQYAVGHGGSSPMTRAVDTHAARMREAESLAARLLEVGADAAEAVAKGLRTQGRWRELLLPYARAHRALRVIRDALELVARRKVDPLAETTASVLAEP